MFKTGSKFLYGLAAFGFVAATAYAYSTDGHRFTKVDSLLGPVTLGYKGYVGEHVGYSILITLAASALFLGIFLSSLRDADPEAEAQVVGLETVPDAPTPDSADYWPVVGAFSAAAIVLGLAIGPAMFVIGAVGLVATTVEWAASAWSARATGDPEVNRAIRGRMMHPIEIPGLAVLGIAGLVLAVSRILLALPAVGGYLVFGLVPAAILGVGALFVLKPKLSQSVVAAILLVGGLAVLAGGVAASIAGERKHPGAEHQEEEHPKGTEADRPAPLPEPGQPWIWVAN